MKHFLFFGTHPRISLAEYAAVGNVTAQPILVGPAAIIEDPSWDGENLMQLLGGTVKLGSIVAEIPVDSCNAKTLLDIIVSQKRADQIVFGMAIIGGTVKMQKDFGRMPIQIKQLLKQQDLRCRWVTGKDSNELSPAAVEKLKLTTEGYDFVLIIHKGIVYIGLTTHVQSADAWSERDYGRPARDDFAGMLPPKLARMMVNIANVQKGETVLDPFCGNGTILMEAGLATDAKMIIGSDIIDKQTRSTQENIHWLIEEDILSSEDRNRFSVFTADAIEISKQLEPESIDVVITEGTMGPPLRGSESIDFIDKSRDEISQLWLETLKKIKPSLKKGARLVIIWPSFKTDAGISRVQLDEEVEQMGYRIINPLENWEEKNNPLIYHRQGQRVARRIVVLRYE